MGCWNPLSSSGDPPPCSDAAKLRDRRIKTTQESFNAGQRPPKPAEGLPQSIQRTASNQRSVSSKNADHCCACQTRGSLLRLEITAIFRPEHPHRGLLAFCVNFLVQLLNIFKILNSRTYNYVIFLFFLSLRPNGSIYHLKIKPLDQAISRKGSEWGDEIRTSSGGHRIFSIS